MGDVMRFDGGFSKIQDAGLVQRQPFVAAVVAAVQSLV